MLKHLAALRKDHAVFKDGQLKMLKAENGVLIYERRSADETMTVCLNRTGETQHELLCKKNVTIEPYGFAIEFET